MNKAVLVAPWAAIFLTAGVAFAQDATAPASSGMTCAELIGMDRNMQTPFLQGYVAGQDDYTASLVQTTGSDPEGDPAADAPADADMEAGQPDAAANETGPAGGPSGGPLGRDPESILTACGNAPESTVSDIFAQAAGAQ